MHFAIASEGILEDLSIYYHVLYWTSVPAYKGIGYLFCVLTTLEGKKRKEKEKKNVPQWNVFRGGHPIAFGILSVDYRVTAEEKYHFLTDIFELEKIKQIW